MRPLGPIFLHRLEKKILLWSLFFCKIVRAHYHFEWMRLDNLQVVGKEEEKIINIFWLKFQLATRITTFFIQHFGMRDLFGRDNYEYYARLTGRILKVEDEWIFFTYPPVSFSSTEAIDTGSLKVCFDFFCCQQLRMIFSRKKNVPTFLNFLNWNFIRFLSRPKPKGLGNF